MYVENTRDMADVAAINIGDISDTRDVRDISSTDNNINGKNTYIKIGFSIYNITSINTSVYVGNINSTKDVSDTNIGDTSITKDADGTDNVDNNINNKNIHIKTCFSIYNTLGVGKSDTSGANKEVGNNIKNTGARQSNKISRTNKSGFGKIK